MLNSHEKRKSNASSPILMLGTVDPPEMIKSHQTELSAHPLFSGVIQSLCHCHNPPPLF